MKKSPKQTNIIGFISLSTFLSLSMALCYTTFLSIVIENCLNRSDIIKYASKITQKIAQLVIIIYNVVAAHMHKTPFFFRKKVASFDLCKLLKLSWHDHTTQLERQKNVDFLPCSFLTCVVMLSITCAAFTIQNDGVSNSVKLPCYA